MRLVIVLYCTASCYMSEKGFVCGCEEPKPQLTSPLHTQRAFSKSVFFLGGLEAGIKHSDILRCELKMHHDASNSKVGTIRLSSRSGHWGSSP